MARAQRVLLGSLGIGITIAGWNSLQQAEAKASAAVEARQEGVSSQERGREPVAPKAAGEAGAEGQSVEADLVEFVGRLGKLRRNDESVLPSMRDLAERLCAVHQRCDAKDVLAFYARMPAEDRAKGIRHQDRLDAIVSKVREHWHTGVFDESWIEIRDRAIEELETIADQSFGEADVFPGACALSFRARVSTNWLLSDYGLGREDRAMLLAEAKADASKSLEAFQRCGMPVPRLEPLWLLGYLRSAEGETVEALESFEECLALADRLRRPDWQERAFQGLIHLAKEAGDTHGIAMLLNELASVRAPTDSWYLVGEQARFLIWQDLGEAASAFLLAHPPSDPLHLREWHILLGSAYLRQKDLAQARDQFGLAQPMPFSRDVALGMASVELRAGNASTILEQLSDPQFMAGIYPYEETLALQFRGEAALRLGKLAEAVSSLERALSIGADIHSRLAVQRDSIGTTTSVVGEFVGLHALALLAEAHSGLGQHMEAARAIENWQSRTLRGSVSSSADISSADLLSWARSVDLGLVTWVVGADSSVLAHVAADGSAHSAGIRHGRRAIEAAVRRLNEAVRECDEPLAARLAAQIGAEVLPDAIKARIGSGPGRTLFLCHGPLERLPLEYLFRDTGVVPLVLPGLPERTPLPAWTPREFSDWTILGSPVDAGGRTLLPGAREELSSIAALHRTEREEGIVQAGGPRAPGAELRIGSAFDRESLLAALRGSGPIHIATHLKHGCGRAQGRLADVGLELSGGSVLCAREILQAHPRVPLAVLSACETAEGRFVEAEGLQGVARAFLDSGTRNLLVTAWPVEDQAARRFAEEFHKALLRDQRPSEAAAIARESLRSAGFPLADWTAFRLLGRD